MPVLTFSRTFPAYHPKAGQLTYFVEKIWKGMYDSEPSNYLPFAGYWQAYYEVFPITSDVNENIHLHHPKYHTIRAGKRWKVGDKFSPRVWSGKPYQSKQIAIATDIEVKKVWSIEMVPAFFFDECEFYVNGSILSYAQIDVLATNDGLLFSEFMSWFAGANMADSNRKPFKGQIICWNENIEY